MIRGRSLTILVHEWVTGGGLAGEPLPPSWAAEGCAMRRALAADFRPPQGERRAVIVTLDARLPEDPGPWNIQRIAPGQLECRVPELAAQADFTVLVAPETTGILARVDARAPVGRSPVLGSLPHAIELTGDKERLCRWFEARGIATPRSRTIIPSEGLPADAEYPAVLKPVDGAGSVDTFT